MEHVFQKLVDLVNEPNSQWEMQFPNKPFMRQVLNLNYLLRLTDSFSDDVQFTFADKVGIPLKYTTVHTTVSTFWTAHSQLNNQYFKKQAIATSTAEIVMLVPIELTVCPSSDAIAYLLNLLSLTARYSF